jgi:hypothetical protein
MGESARYAFGDWHYSDSYRPFTEAWGEDYVLTTHMGVAFSSGMSKDGQWHEPDAVVPVVKVPFLSVVLSTHTELFT